MRCVLILAMLGTIPGGSAAAFLQSGKEKNGVRETSKAEIRLETTSHDFGTVLHGEVVSAEIPFWNSGDDILKLYPYTDEDRAVSVSVPENSIEPGKSGHFEVTLKTEGRIGNVRDSIPVFTNDPERREIFLKVAATIKPLIAAYPPVYHVGEVAKEDSFIGSAPLVGTLADEDRLSDLILEPSSQYLRARVTKRFSSEGSIPVIEFVLLPDLMPGSIEETITIVSKDPPARAYLRVFGVKEGDIRVVPDRLMILLNEDGDINEYTMTVESDRPFHITGVEDSQDLLELTTRTIVADSKYELVASLRYIVGESQMGVVRIHTDLEGEALVEIPFLVGVVQPGD